MKHVFITGASSGIGFAIAEALLARGHEVWGTSRDLGRLPRRDRFHPVELDLGDEKEVDRVFMNVVAEGTYLDVVINNAGGGHFGPAEFLPTADISQMFQVLFFSPVRLMQLALAEMRSRQTGLIINVSSLAERLPVPFMAAYNAAKAALASFTASIQVELPPGPIRIIDLQPADISTRFNESVTKAEQASIYSAAVAKTWDVVDRNLKRAPGPELVAAQVIKLIAQTNPAPRVTVGDTFQARVAPLIFRLLPQRLGIWGLKQYYHLK